MKHEVPTWFKRLAQVVLALVVIVLIGNYLQDQFAQIDLKTLDINGWYLLLSLGLTTFSLLLLPAGCWLILRGLDHPLPAPKVWHIFYLTNISRYLPGSVWALPGRALFYRNAGIPGLHSLIAVLWEVILIVISAILVALLSLRIVALYLPGSLLIWMLLLSAVGVFLVVILCRLVSIPMPPLLKQVVEDKTTWLSPWSTALVIVIYLLAWGSVGVSFGFLVRAFTSSVSLVHHVELTGVYMGSWVVGFLVIIAPGGIGVRDALIVLGVATFLNDPLPVVIAVTARIMWTLAEVIGLILVLIYTHMHISSPLVDSYGVISDEVETM